jgi:hypothetical protein
MDKIVKTAAIVRSILLALLLTAPISAHGQGCSLCKDTTAGASPQQRQGLRRAILILGIPAGAIFLTILVIARKSQPRQEAD